MLDVHASETACVRESARVREKDTGHVHESEIAFHSQCKWTLSVFVPVVNFRRDLKLSTGCRVLSGLCIAPIESPFGSHQVMSCGQRTTYRSIFKQKLSISQSEYNIPETNRRRELQ